MRRLIHQIEANSQFINEKRKVVPFLPNDPAAAGFLQDEKKEGASPLSQYVKVLQQRAQQRNDKLLEFSVLVGEHSSIFGKNLPENNEDVPVEEGAAIFSSSWLPGGESKAKKSSKDDKKKKKKKGKEQQEDMNSDEDIVEDLVLSFDEDESFSDFSAEENGENSAARSSKKRKFSKTSSKTSKKRVSESPSSNGAAKSLLAKLK